MPCRNAAVAQCFSLEKMTLYVTLHHGSVDDFFFYCPNSIYLLHFSVGSLTVFDLIWPSASFSVLRMSFSVLENICMCSCINYNLIYLFVPPIFVFCFLHFLVFSHLTMHFFFFFSHKRIQSLPQKTIKPL